jgi:hypothetical protein
LRVFTRPPTVSDLIRLARRLPEAERLRYLTAARERLLATSDPQERAIERFLILLFTHCRDARIRLA